MDSRPIYAALNLMLKKLDKEQEFETASREFTFAEMRIIIAGIKSAVQQQQMDCEADSARIDARIMANLLQEPASPRLFGRLFGVNK